MGQILTTSTEKGDAIDGQILLETVVTEYLDTEQKNVANARIQDTLNVVTEPDSRIVPRIVEADSVKEGILQEA
jgi:hypothetical protein